MDLNQVRYFLNLAESLNFTEAARVSGISQPSLTKAIQRLEDEFGGPVLYRDGKDTRLTALGRDLIVEFMRIQSALENITELAENSVAGRSRKINIGVASTIAPRVFAKFWALVLKELPEVELLLHPLNPGEAEAEVLSGKYDMCLLTNPPEPNFKLTIQPLFQERLRLALASHHPLAGTDEITPEQMMEQPYIDRMHCEFRTQLIKHFMDRNIVMRPRFQSEREDWVQQMVAQGAGVCSLPEHSAIVDGIVLRAVKGLTLSRNISMVAVSGSANPREVRVILGLSKNFNW
ncbi:LysR family transcriptional regulator [Albidovulum sediminis]|jgi:LysR family hydrogen peroxide-inducible transcriptional activator|uniref:LysR family transcriptional regulator n=1 Tax=Albidovulum sediminis TaxID=3066345 RepID=A0ABT2NSK7_9RHOB|nr:LysR family transcriptional regulator [Defluviimonas sediminis]MCT8331896.1 LysR family transcriptional regulator [Defluviimonas sediminis]